MTNPILDRYLDDVRRHLKGLPRKEQAETLEEMRVHLEEDVAGRMAKDPTLTIEQASLDATHDFGEPAEIARARAPPPAKRMPVAAKVALGAVAVLLVAVIAGAVLDELAGGAADHAEQIYDRSIEYSGQSGEENTTFWVPSSTQEVTLDIHLQNTSPNATGCLSVIVVNPSGTTVFDSGDSCGELYHTATFYGTGYWKVQYRFERFVGHVNVRVIGR